MDKAKKFKEFCNKLSKYRKTMPESEFDAGRETLCHIIMLTEHNGIRYAKFEVRGYRIYPEYVDISVVNWTILAGTGTLYIKLDNIHEWDILEENPTLQVLYGN